MKLTNTRLLVNDFPKTFLFYRDALGLTASFGNENDVYSEFETDGTILALFQRPLMQDALAASTSPISAWSGASDAVLLAFGVEDVDQAYAEFVTKGVVFIIEPTDRPVWGIRTAHLRDPEGNIVEIFSPLKIAS